MTVTGSFDPGSGWPAGLTGTIDPNPSLTFSPWVVHVTAAPSVPAGTYIAVANGLGPAGKCEIYANGVTVTVTATNPQLKINLLPQPPAQNQYIINNVPKMPVIQASAQVINATPDPTPQTTFMWTVNLNVKKGTGQTVAYDSYVTQNMQTTGTGTFTFTLTNPSDLVGGNLTFNVSAVVNGKTLTASTPAGLSIAGTNPVRASIQNNIGTAVAGTSFSGLATSDVTDALDRVACIESSQREFNAGADGGIGPVLISSDNGVGIFQLTSPNPFRDPNLLFDWTANVKQGIKAFKGKVTPAKNYSRTLSRNKKYQSWISNEINPVRESVGLSPITVATLSSYTTSGPIGTTPTAELNDELLHDAVRGYNGYAGSLLLPAVSTAGNAYNAGLLHEFQPNITFLETVPDNQLSSLSTNPSVWQVVPVSARPSNKGDANYVQDVANKSPTCGG